MSCFEEVSIRWGVSEYKIPPNRVMGLIESIESVITLDEINAMLVGGKIQRAQISRAYSAAICYAGGAASSDDVYDTLFGDQMMTSTVTVLTGLLSMMIPPSHLRSKSNPNEVAQKKKGSRSSVKRT